MKLDYDTVREIAIGYSTLGDFRTNERSAYNKARAEGWLKSFDWLKTDRKRYTIEELFELAKNYDSLMAFVRDNFNGYRAAKRMGILDQFTWMERAWPDYEWDDIMNALVFCKSADEFKAKHPKMYESAIRRRWAKRIREAAGASSGEQAHADPAAHPDSPPADHPAHSAPAPARPPKAGRKDAPRQGERYEKAKAAAMRYATVGEFREGSPYWYNKSSEFGWLGDFDWLERKRRRFTRAYLEETARRYDSMDRFYKECFNEYRAALKTGQLIEFTWLECSSRPCAWEDAAAAAMQSGSLEQFRKDHPKLYLHAARRRWLDRIRGLFPDARPSGASEPRRKNASEEYYKIYERVVNEEIARRKAEERKAEKASGKPADPLQAAPPQDVPAQAAPGAPARPAGVSPEVADLAAVLSAERGSRPARKSAEAILSESYREIGRAGDCLLESMNEVAGGGFCAAPVDKDIYYGTEQNCRYDESDY